MKEKNNMEADSKDTKMVIVMRKDLKNTKGEKIRSGKGISQGGHSVLGFVWQNLVGRKICFELTDVQYKWATTGQTKITLKVESENALLEIYQAAKDAGLFVEMITDEGRTEFGEPTKTCLSIGPDYSDKIDKITAHLSTY